MVVSIASVVDPQTELSGARQATAMETGRQRLVCEQQGELP